MRTISLPVLVTFALTTAATLPARSQSPTISARSYTGGSATIVVTGSFQIEKEVPINTAASFSDGEMTWLQFGVSGSPEPNALITYGPNGDGVNAALGRKTAIAGAEDCKGTVEVTATQVTGDYDCAGVTSFDAGTGSMGTVRIRIRYTART
jgi:hypothetical protein